MNEEERQIIKFLRGEQKLDISLVFSYLPQLIKCAERLEQELQAEKEKYKRLSIEAQATAFDDQNHDTEGLLRVLLKQGEISLDEKGYYKRNNFDWEENLYKLGLMKKREKNFYIPDNECLDEYTKQLESQLKEYNELKEMFKKYYVTDNETMYDGCCKMQDELDKEKEKNKELTDLVDAVQEFKRLDRPVIELVHEMQKFEDDFVSKDKIKEKIEFYKRYGKIENSDEYVMSVEIEVLQELLEE